MVAKAGKRITKSYSQEDKKQAALVFTVEGLASRTSRKTNIPETTISFWVNSDWWPAMLAEARREKQHELDAAYTRIIDNATAGTLERLDKGDAVHYKGEVFFKPMSGKDCIMTAAIAHDKRALMRGDPTSRTERITTDSRLKTLQAEFRTASDVEVISQT